MIRALVFSLVLSFLQMFIFAHTTMTGEMLGLFPVFNVCLVLILLEIRLFIIDVGYKRFSFCDISSLSYVTLIPRTSKTKVSIFL